MKKFTFTFVGKNAQEVQERFSAHYWDGGLDQYLEQDFLEGIGLDSDDTEFDDEGGVIIHTDKAVL